MVVVLDEDRRMVAASRTRPAVARGVVVGERFRERLLEASGGRDPIWRSRTTSTAARRLVLPDGAGTVSPPTRSSASGAPRRSRTSCGRRSPA